MLDARVVPMGAGAQRMVTFAVTSGRSFAKEPAVLHPYKRTDRLRKGGRIRIKRPMSPDYRICLRMCLNLAADGKVAVAS